MYIYFINKTDSRKLHFFNLSYYFYTVIQYTKQAISFFNYNFLCFHLIVSKCRITLESG